MRERRGREGGKSLGKGRTEDEGNEGVRQREA